MAKHYITSTQITTVMILFIFGSSVILGINTDTKQDTWISLITAILISIPLLLIYARIIKLYPEQDIFVIAETLFGKIIGKIITILMIWYAIHLGALVLRNFSEYIEISTLLDTPQIVVMIMMILIIVYIAKSNVETFGKWAMVVFPVVILMVVITVLTSIGYMDFGNLSPIMEHSTGEIINSAYKIVSFPFAETILLLPIARFIKKSDNPYKIFMQGLLIGGLILLIIVIRNITVLNITTMNASYFPSLTAARVIEIGDFLTKIDGAITINFVFAGLTKIAVCLIAAAIGMSRLFGEKQYKDFIIPAALLILTLCAIIYTNIIEMFAFVDIYAIYAIPFQIIIPILLWIGAEIKIRKNKLSN